jgi:hypothetical protein
MKTKFSKCATEIIAFLRKKIAKNAVGGWIFHLSYFAPELRIAITSTAGNV